ncbi:SAM-dependent methyltransferase [Spirillospora sp. CA-108201]
MSSQPEIDTTVPHSARIWNFLLGGVDNYPVDRQAGEGIFTVFPGMVAMARQSRRMLRRVVRHLAGEAGVRQFLDIGTGLPTMDNTHEIAQRLAPASRTLDHGEPVALMLMGILGLVGDYDQARSIVGRLMAALPSGSHLAVCDGTDSDPAYTDAIRTCNSASGAVPYIPRTQEQIAGYFDGLELLEPGVVPVTRWRPDPGQEDVPEVSCSGGLARKP